MGFTMLKSRCWYGCIPSGGSKEEFVSLSFSVSRGQLYVLAHVSILHVQCQQHSIFESLPLTLTPDSIIHHLPGL